MPTVYEIITDDILKKIAAGVAPWTKPWKGDSMAAANYQGRKYNGANAFILNMLGYAVPVWLTYKQIAENGGTIKDDQKDKSIPVVFWSWVFPKGSKKDEDKFPLLRYFRVWNIDQTENVALPAWYVKSQKAGETAVINPIANCEAIVQGFVNPPTISHGGGVACYRPSVDAVTVPNMSDFNSAEEYYATVFHELGHSTGHAKRLNRKEITKDIMRFGDHDYSIEELVAELTACFLASHAQIDAVTGDNSASYLKGWWDKLKSDPKMFVTAAARAQKAANLILGIKPDFAKDDSEE